MVPIPPPVTLSMPMTVRIWPSTTRQHRQGKTLLQVSTWHVMCLGLQPTTSIFPVSAGRRNARSLKTGKMAKKHCGLSSPHPTEPAHERKNNQLCFPPSSDDLLRLSPSPPM